MAPYRTGIPTALQLARKLCQILTKYETVIKAVIDPSKHVYVDALIEACSDFQNNIEHPNKGD